MNENVSDHRKRSFFQKVLWEYPHEREVLKGLRLCGKSVLHTPFNVSSVHILSNGKESKLWGTLTCRSAWACPYCSARVMADKGTKIACAIDALSTWYQQSAMMLTFTLPHTKDMSAKETFSLLKATWRLFSKICKQKSVSRINKAGEKVFRGNNIWGKFREDLEIEHWVKVYEFTWGENSWHPHIHALFWTPNDLLQKAKYYEADLNEFWWHCAKHEAKKYYAKKYASVDKANQIINSLFADYKKAHPCITISKDKKGNVKKQKSAHYISGWGGDSELTGSERPKYAKEGHYTPHAILEQAYSLRDKPEEAKPWIDLYIEYCMATFRVRRVEFSKRSKESLNEIIERWKKSEGFMTIYKKKCMEAGKWKTVVWFTENQWSDILYKEHETGDFIVSMILQLASSRRFSIESRTFKILDFLLSNYDINCYENINGSDFCNHMWEKSQWVEEQLFDNQIPA